MGIVKSCEICGNTNNLKKSFIVNKECKLCDECYAKLKRFENNTELILDFYFCNWDYISTQLKANLLARPVISDYVKNRQRELLKQAGNEGYWEYKVVEWIDEDGRVDCNRMALILNDLGMQGWKVSSAYSNELGKNAISVAGIGVNSSVDQNVLILERFIKF